MSTRTQESTTEERLEELQNRVNDAIALPDSPERPYILLDILEESLGFLEELWDGAIEKLDQKGLQSPLHKV